MGGTPFSCRIALWVSKSKIINWHHSEEMSTTKLWAD